MCKSRAQDRSSGDCASQALSRRSEPRSTWWPKLPRELYLPFALEPEAAWLQGLPLEAKRPGYSSTREGRPLRTTEGILAKGLRGGHGTCPKAKVGKIHPSRPWHLPVR